MGTIITLASIAVGTAVTEKILLSLGKGDMAQMTNIVGLSTMGATAVVKIVAVFVELKKLG